MSKPRIHVLALGGTIATRPGCVRRHADGAGRRRSRGRGAGAGELAEIDAETVSRVGSHSLSFDQIHALAVKIRGLDGRRRHRDARHRHARGDVRSCSTCCSICDDPGDRDGGDAQSRAHLARRAGQPAGRRARRLRSVGAGAMPGRSACIAVMLDEVYAAADVAQGPSDAAQRLRVGADRSARCAGRGSRRAAVAAGARRRRRRAQGARQA